jgi:Ulp1 family protease
LVFPPESQGAVSITTADLKRLQPGEFLNDTLIEFGLKLDLLLELLIEDELTRTPGYG